MKKVKIWMGISKGELMKIAYDNNANKLGNVDVALPQTFLDANPNAMRFWFVMDYNTNSVFGEVRNLKDVAMENGIEFTY